MSGERERAPSAEEKICVLVVDDQRLFADGLARIIGAQPDMEVLETVHDGKAAVEICRERAPDVVLMDVSMPIMDGIAATREIRNLLPDAAILILTVHTDDRRVYEGIKAGARGYVLKDYTPEDLTRAIRAVAAGNMIVAPAIARMVLATFEGKRPEIFPPLTEREVAVIRALARGMSNKEIARELGISEKTVRNHTSNIYRKLHIFDRTQAVLYAVREGLVDLNGPEETPGPAP